MGDEMKTKTLKDLKSGREGEFLLGAKHLPNEKDEIEFWKRRFAKRMVQTDLVEQGLAEFGLEDEFIITGDYPGGEFRLEMEALQREKDIIVLK